jgi:hypothetical protein
VDTSERVRIWQHSAGTFCSNAESNFATDFAELQLKKAVITCELNSPSVDYKVVT